MRAKGWAGLRPIQSTAARAFLESDGDVIVSAGTASGKTEAAFLPALSSLLHTPSPTAGILCVSPLKSLINDQYGRLTEIGKAADVRVTRWHGETPREEKRDLRLRPEGVVIITPESLEAMFLNRGSDVQRLFGSLRCVVIDEMHAFLAGDRGAQVASLLARLDRACGRRARRIGLSATLGDPGMAAAWICPRSPGTVVLVEEEAASRRIATRIECFVDNMPEFGTDEVAAEEMGYATGLSQMAAQLYPRLSKGKNIVFASSRRTVEALADGLRRRAERAGRDNVFLPHHGSLSKAFRETVEIALKDPERPATAVATTSLELGIDVGDVARVVQVGPPRSLASLRQRVGRSGRREGTVPTLDLAVSVRAPRRDAGPMDTLHPDLVCALACVHLLHKGFVEPPSEPASLSVLVHQVACIAKDGATDTQRLLSVLRDVAPFQAFTAERLRDLLMRLSSRECAILERLGQGVVRLGPAGRAMLEGPDAFSVFSTPVEFALVFAGTTLGQVPVLGGAPVGPGDNLLFQGQRWSVERIDVEGKAVHVVPAPKGASLKFEGGEPAPMHDRIPAVMRQVYESDQVPGTLDPTGRAVLATARRTYRKLKLGKAAIHASGPDTVVMPFLGTLRLRALALALQAEGFSTAVGPYTVEVERARPEDVQRALATVAGQDHPLKEIFCASSMVPEGKFDGRLDPGFRSSWWVEVNDVVRLARESAVLALRPGAPASRARQAKPRAKAGKAAA